MKQLQENPCPPRIRLWPCVVLVLLFALAGPCLGAEVSLFGYREKPRKSLDALPHWLGVMERHLRQDMEGAAAASGTIREEVIGPWKQFLDSVRNAAPEKQIELVNEFANRRRYVLDIENYGVPDYWAIVREFLANNGDCEDFAITKFFSLRLLGFEDARLRIVILQDTNLRTPHAVVAVRNGGSYLILDNQTRRVTRQEEIVHYAPLYSVNEEGWWMYLPPIR